MKERFVVLALALNLVAIGAGLGVWAVSTHIRVSKVEGAQAGMIQDLNQKVLPEIQKELEQIKAALAPASAVKKGG